ncbi:hypothetical protein EJB05_34669 [Eragrostis curvula]|uniref:PB1 domain-containing protein n=1 Tax=Eragrostis curvula TaxID=38414 RepID=A0A5J9U4I4_9POAL|nr:hypothetical protein EJB05_34669 [Eragrostis curvula]
MELDSSDAGDAWMLDAMASSLLFPADSPPLLPPWPCGDDKQHPSTAPDTTHLDDDTPGAPTGDSETTERGEYFNGKCQVHLSQVDDYSDSSFFLKQRLTLALRYLKESTNQHLLVQIWAPVRNGGRYILSTSGQPFVLDQRSIGLLQYRAISMMYTFSIDGDSVQDLGLPGRVFKQRIPEWTPNVQYYRSTEYARLNHAISYNVHGTVALPVFDPSVKSCIAVLELIMTSKKINYASEIDKVCKALETVNLRSTEVVEHSYVQIYNERHQAALADMLEVLTVTCEELKLPLAQTWIPCKYQNLLTHFDGVKNSCFSAHESCVQESCISASDVAFHVIDARMWGFRDACVEHHLQKGQGVSGKAFILRRPCFSRDVTRFSKMEYSLVHYARMFGLAGCFSICLQSAYTGNDDYVLEFFLPPDCRNDDDQKVVLESILVVLRLHLHSLRVSTDDGLNEVCLQVDAITVVDNEEIEDGHIQHRNFKSGIHASYESDMHGVKESDNMTVVSSTNYERHLLQENESKCNYKIFSKTTSEFMSDSSLVDINSKQHGKRRGKAEKKISLDVIQQYFSGSLKSAAKSLGVCPTTMKRICRQHGISRWPSRQISKVNRSISKLKKVIESAEGPEGAFNLTSVTCPVSVPFHQFNSMNKEKGRESKVTEVSIPSTQERRCSPSHNKPLESGGLLRTSQPQHRFLADISTLVEVEKASNLSSSGEPSTHSGMSDESYHGGPAKNTLDQKVIEPQNMCKQKEPFQGQNLLFPSLFVNGSESSQYFRNHVISSVTQPTAVPTGNPMSMQNSEIITVKARYKEDILRFRFPLTGSFVTLKEEVAKRVQMDVGVFDIKYLDDDNEWVKLTCDADLAECMEISLLSSSNVLRLLVTDIAVIIGSSCGSTG